MITTVSYLKITDGGANDEHGAGSKGGSEKHTGDEACRQ